MQEKRQTARSMMSLVFLTAAALATVLLVAACKRDGAVNLSGAGATFPYPLYSKWFDMYGREHGVAINYQSIGSGGGIKQLQAGTVDFGASDAPLSDAEAKEMPGPVIHLPMVAGAVVLAYNLPGVAQGLRLDSKTIAGFFQGDITDWSDPKIAAINPGVALPKLPVVIAHRSDGSGTSYIFTSYLAAISPQWKNTVGAGKAVNWPVGIGGKGNEGVAGVLKQTPGSIGYVELAYASQNKLPMAAVKNAAGAWVEPGIASTTAAASGAAAKMRSDVRVSIVNAPGKEAYPICGFTYILLYREQSNAAKGKALVDFLNWAIHDGQREASPLLYAPLPAAVVALNDQALGTVTSAGKPLLPAAK